jgi:hypothetical protein
VHSVFLVILCLALASGSALGVCIPFNEARAHIGKTRCIAGKIVKVTRSGFTTFLNYCADYRVCPFQVVIFRGDLRHVGDVRQLEGRIIEISGEIKEYEGRPEIILKDVRQLRGEAARISPLPKNFDVEKKPRYSAGRFSYPKAGRRPTPKQQGKPVPTDDPAEIADPE